MSAALSSVGETVVGFEVATASADTLRASIVVTGEINTGSASLLATVLRSHLRAGRRYLRVDLADAQVTDPCVVEDLVRAHRSVTELGGMLVFENASAQLREWAGEHTLFFRGPA